MSDRHPTIERRAAMRTEEVRNLLGKATKYGHPITIDEQLRLHEESFRQGVLAALVAVNRDMAQIRVGEEIDQPPPRLLRFPEPPAGERKDIFPRPATEARFLKWPVSHPVPIHEWAERNLSPEPRKG